MATWPANVIPMLSGYTESPSDIAERSPMDRGIPKQRRTQSDLLVIASFQVQFKTKQAAIDFEDWYYSNSGAAAGMAYFDWVLPRTGETVQARVVANSLGPLTTPGPLRITRRSIQIEYLKALTL